jgi:citrate synthase
MAQIIPAKLTEFKDIKLKYGDKKMGEFKVSQALGGMRGITGLFYETSKLDAQKVFFLINKGYYV